MTGLVLILWPALAASLALGLFVGAATGLPRGRAARAATLALIALAVTSSTVALAAIVPGRIGLVVEVAASLLDLYLVGCGLGAATGLARARRARA